MQDFVDTFSRTSLADLRRLVMAGRAESDQPLVPGLYLTWDTDGTGIDVAYDSPDWALVSLTARVQAAPRWFSLNLSLAEGRLNPGDTLVIVGEGYAGEAITLPVRLLSLIDDERYETEWDESLSFGISNGISVAMRTLEAVDAISGQDGFHTLILEMPAHDWAMTIRNLRVARLPAGRDLEGLSAATKTLSSLAV